MPKASKPALKDRNSRTEVMAVSSVWKLARSRGYPPSQSTQSFPVSSRRLSQHALTAERGKPVGFQPLAKVGQRIVRNAYDSAGKGGSRKQMPFCNGRDTG